ncbi:Smr/MutS family protein [Mycoplasma buteonis]|uniref:Smr/MutS family protein n=1 Tax=Mycoplasma buteonis TaxID=171280 RepID=UPI0005676D17|nr:Smr/MutS family protein [Mycoplasma buteonis]
MKTVDLHGLESQEASIIVLKEILSFKKGLIDELFLVTGHGTGILKVTVEDLLRKNDLNYKLSNNSGAFYLSKSNNFDYFYNIKYNEDDEQIIDEQEIKDLFDEFSLK